MLDLGLALVLEATSLTKHSGATMGTIDYMAPEQVTDAHKVDVRADVYSLGCTLYHLLTGKVPFDNVHPAARLLIRQERDPHPVEQHCLDVPGGLGAVVRQMLARQPENRYSTPGEVATALQPFSGAAGVLDKATVPPLPAPAKASAAASILGKETVLPVPPPLPPARDIAASKGDSQGNSWPATDSAGTRRPHPGRGAKTQSLDQEPGRQGGERGGGAGAAPPRNWVAVVVVLALLVLTVGGVSAVVLLGLHKKDKLENGASAAPAGVPGQIENSIGMKLVPIPKGTFTMGSPRAEQGKGNEDEGPQHKVEITKPFYLSVHEVTQGQFKAVMGYNPSYFSTDGKGKDGVTYIAEPSGGKDKVKDLGSTDDLPVENVSWEEAQTFLEKLSARPEEKEKGRKYRLPTEAEWEYSCRGGVSEYQVFHFGNSLSSKQANFDGKSPYGGADIGDYLQRTCKVGLYSPNGYGLYDMHGNVWEWCEDRYGSDYYKTSPRRDPPGPPEGSYRVLRGGSWYGHGQYCRPAYRSGGRSQAPSGRLLSSLRPSGGLGGDSPPARAFFF